MFAATRPERQRRGNPSNDYVFKIPDYQRPYAWTTEQARDLLDDLTLASSALQLDPTEQYETYRVFNGPIYDTLAARARSSILLRLDALMSGGGATYDSDTTTVEHVLPQNPEVAS